MGRTGPAPTPIAILEARGSPRATRGRKTVSVEVNAPECPEWLSDDAKAYWRVLIPQLIAQGTVNEIDEKSIARYCEAWAEYRLLTAFINENGRTYVVMEKGFAKSRRAYPEVGMRERASQTMLRFEQEFGLTPSSRSRISANVKEEKQTNKSRFFPRLSAG